MRDGKIGPGLFVHYAWRRISHLWMSSQSAAGCIFCRKLQPFREMGLNLKWWERFTKFILEVSPAQVTGLANANCSAGNKWQQIVYQTSVCIEQDCVGRAALQLQSGWPPSHPPPSPSIPSSGLQIRLQHFTPFPVLLPDVQRILGHQQVSMYASHPSSCIAGCINAKGDASWTVIIEIYDKKRPNALCIFDQLLWTKHPRTMIHEMSANWEYQIPHRTKYLVVDGLQVKRASHVFVWSARLYKGNSIHVWSENPLCKEIEAPTSILQLVYTVITTANGSNLDCFC